MKHLHTCKNCRFSYQLKDYLVCVRHSPPTLTVQSSKEQDNQIKAGQYYASMSQWPIVGADYSCGDFEYDEEIISDWHFYKNWYEQTAAECRKLKAKCKKQVRQIEKLKAAAIKQKTPSEDDNLPQGANQEVDPAIQEFAQDGPPPAAKKDQRKD